MTARELFRNIKSKQPEWFSQKNKNFFKDIKYWAVFSKSRKPFLARLTYGWTDMFGSEVRAHIRLNEIREDFSIGSLIGLGCQKPELRDQEDLKAWLQEN